MNLLLLFACRHLNITKAININRCKLVREKAYIAGIPTVSRIKIMGTHTNEYVGKYQGNSSPLLVK